MMWPLPTVRVATSPWGSFQATYILSKEQEEMHSPCGDLACSSLLWELPFLLVGDIFQCYPSARKQEEKEEGAKSPQVPLLGHAHWSHFFPIGYAS